MSALQPSHPEDLAFVARIVSGDELAEEEFALAYSDRFVYLARRKGVPRQDCQDVAQEIMLAALSQMRRGVFRGESKLSSWLEQIAHGKTMDYWRDRKGLAVLSPLEPEEDDWRGVVEMLPAPMTDYELIFWVREALKTLPSQHRFILLMNRTGGYTLEEISRMLEMTIGQASGRLYSAEEMFRRGLFERTPPGEDVTNKALLPGNHFAPRGTREQSVHHRSFLGLHRAGDRQVAYDLLLWSRFGAGAAIGRGASARM